MADTSIDDLFDLNRCQKTWDLFPLFFYFPLGIVLALVRFFVGLHAFLAACILPKSSVVRCIVLRTMCTVLGVIVRQQNIANREKAIKVIVTNHVTTLDHLAVDLVWPCIVPGVWDLPSFLNWSLGFKDFGVKQGRDVLINNVRGHIQESDIPVLSHPEGATTNGTTGLLRFSTWPFSLEYPVQPILIKTLRPPVMNIAPSVLGSRWWSDLFWFLFVPFTLFTLRYLPAMERKAEESIEEFCLRVQQIMAQEMELIPTHFTCSDKVEHTKRVLKLPPSRTSQHSAVVQNVSTQNTSLIVSDISYMANQVKEVLPHVPLDVIRQDLTLTRSVDVTITRILEGAVTYSPLPDRITEIKGLFTTANNFTESNGKQQCGGTSSGLLPSPNSTASLQRFSPIKTSAQFFGKTPEERMQSYQDRKRHLIEAAQRMYLQKHGIL